MKQRSPHEPRIVRDRDPLDLRESARVPKRASFFDETAPKADVWYDDFTDVGGKKRTFFQAVAAIIRRCVDGEVGLLAGGVAFFFFVGLIPMLAMAVSLWALVSDPAQIHSHLSMLQLMLPTSAFELVSEQLQEIASSENEVLGWSLVVSLLLTLWSAKKGTSALTRALDVVYDMRENRSYWSRTALAIVLTLGSILLAFVVLGVSIALPMSAPLLFDSPHADLIISWARWPVLLFIMLLALGILYKIAPKRRLKFRIASPGALFATLAWLCVSYGFSVYAGRAGGYDETYGALGGVVVLLVWLWLTFVVILVGSAINAETGALEPNRRASR